MPCNCNVVLVVLGLIGLSGCVTQRIQPDHSIPMSAPAYTTKVITIHDTQIIYRDLSRPVTTSPIDLSQSRREPTQMTKSTISAVRKGESTQPDQNIDIQHIQKKPNGNTLNQKERTITARKSNLKAGPDLKLTSDDQIVAYSPISTPYTKRIVMKSDQKGVSNQYNVCRNESAKTKRHANNTQYVGFWQWLFGKRKPETRPIVKIVPKPDPAMVDQPAQVFFKYARIDQLEDGQLEKLLRLSEQANTTAIYEVRGTAGFMGKTAERIGRERAEFIKEMLINVGVSRTQIRIMAYDASLPGLRGVVTLRDGETI